MKRVLCIYLLVVSALFISACAKDDWSGEKSSQNGIYLDGEIIVSLQSAFAGGSTADPTWGTSHRFHLFEQKIESCPNWFEVPAVVGIEGFRHSGKEYESLGKAVDYINLIFPVQIAGLGNTLDIPMEQGKYKGESREVSAVKIIRYSLSTVENSVERKHNNDGEIEIVITLKDGRSLRIHYHGATPNDNVF